MNQIQALAIFDKLKEFDDRFHVAGSLRRGNKSIGFHDLDAVYVGKEIPVPDFAELVQNGDQKKVFRIEGEQVDVFRCDEENFGATLLYLTGSKDFGVELRKLAKSMKMKLSQEGLFDRLGNPLAGRTEEGIFKVLGMKYYKPNEREVPKSHAKENKKIVDAFTELSMLSFVKKDHWKGKAYENAARILEDTPDPEGLAMEYSLAKVRGIGKGIQDKVREFAQTGRITKLEMLRKEFPIKFWELIDIQGIGWKTIRMFYEELKICNIEDLKARCEDDSVSKLPRMGLMSQYKIVKEIERIENRTA